MLNNVAQLLGRVLMSAIFIQGGINKAMASEATIAGFAKYPLLPNPSLAFAVTLVVEIGVGIAVLVGWKTKWAALTLAFWCIATAIVAHYHPGDRGQMIHFMKNVAMAGGFLQLFVLGAGRFSIDKR
jgi:putative oxidoreductase